MALDRDLGVALLRAAAPAGGGGTGAELFAATGVRGLRLFAESGRLDRCLLLERQPEALAVLAGNARPFPGVRVVRGNAARPPFRGPLDYVDLDPFGTPAPYLDAALGLLRPDGLLAVTATDLPVLTGVARGVAERRYGGRPVRGRLGPEGGLRLLLAWIARRARAAGRTARPIAAYVQGHHLRALVRVLGAAPGEDPIGPIDPSSFDGPPLPPGAPYGPLWLGGLFDPAVIERLEVPAQPARPRECARWVARFREEAGLVAPFYYEPNELARSLRLPAPPSPEAILEELRRRGARAVRTHVREAAIRTDASRATVEAAALAAAGAGGR